MNDDRTRVTVADWELYMKKYISYDPNSPLTPQFGYLIDQFRINYNIYVAVSPDTNPKISDLPTDRQVYGYRSDVYKRSENNVIIRWSGNNTSFYLAMRAALNKAAEFIPL